MRRYEEAANAYSSYINLLPNKDRSAKAAWARAEVRFLRAFGARPPLNIEPASAGKLHTMPFRVLNEKIIVKARVNRGPQMDFVLDTGSEQTVISRETAARMGIRPIVNILSAGRRRSRRARARADAARRAGDRVAQSHNVPSIIKNPPLHGLPTREMESFSPLALGMSVIIDYDRQQLVMGDQLPDETAEVELPLRMHRLAMVPGHVQGGAASFILDTGGQVISISTDTASGLERGEMRNIPLKVYGASGWDRDAFLMPGVNLNFTNKIEYKNLSVVVLNLRAPSVLLGFRLGGIVGYKFLSRYRVAINLDKSIVQLQARSQRSETGELGDVQTSTIFRSVRAARDVRRGGFGGRLLQPLFLGLDVERRDLRARALLFQRHECQIRAAGHLTPARQRLLREHRHFDFQRRSEHRRHSCLQHDEVADFDRIEELEAVDRRRHDGSAHGGTRRSRRRCRSGASPRRRA